MCKKYCLCFKIDDSFSFLGYYKIYETFQKTGKFILLEFPYITLTWKKDSNQKLCHL